jgi:NAD(P)-dependent dehydrogenase (short-subunit alcohol dehydrogenase family)
VAAEALTADLGPRAAAFRADVTDSAQSTEHFDAPDVLVHNTLADFAFNDDARTDLDRLCLADIAQQTVTAVGGALNCLAAMQAHCAAQGFGRVIAIGTNQLKNPAVPYHDYTAAKAALLAFTRPTAQELGPLGITMNMVSGGLLRTTDASAATPDAVSENHRIPNPAWPREHTGRYGRCRAVLCVAMGAGGDGTESDRRWWAGVRVRDHRRVPTARTSENCGHQLLKRPVCGRSHLKRQKGPRFSGGLDKR